MPIGSPGRRGSHSGGDLSQEGLLRAQREVKALEFRKLRLDFETIADRTGYKSASGAHKAVQRVLASGARVADRFDRALEIERLGAVFRALWPMLDNTAVSPSRRRQAIRCLLRVMDLQLRITPDFWPSYDGAHRTTGHLPVHELEELGESMASGFTVVGQVQIGGSPAPVMGLWTEALQLRSGGSTFEDIACTLGFSNRSAARRRIRGDLRKFRVGAVNQYLALELHLLQVAHAKDWEAATRELSQFSDFPDLKAVERLVKVIERRCKLLGLFLPPISLSPAPGAYIRIGGY